jgi:hypothetical protein
VYNYVSVNQRGGSAVPTIKPRRSLDELATLGNDIFDEQVGPTLSPADDGKFVAIDIDTADCDVDKHDYTAVTRLRSGNHIARITALKVSLEFAYDIHPCKPSSSPSATNWSLAKPSTPIPPGSASN